MGEGIEQAGDKYSGAHPRTLRKSPRRAKREEVRALRRLANFCGQLVAREARPTRLPRVGLNLRRVTPVKEIFPSTFFVSHQTSNFFWFLFYSLARRCLFARESSVFVNTLVAESLMRVGRKESGILIKDGRGGVVGRGMHCSGMTQPVSRRPASRHCAQYVARPSLTCRSRPTPSDGRRKKRAPRRLRGLRVSALVRMRVPASRHPGVASPC